MTSRTDPDQGRLAVETHDEGNTTHIILRGEADDTNLADLETALAGIQPNGTHELQLEVSDLSFIDVAALRHLTLFARQMKETGREVKTRDAGPMLAQLIRLVGVEDDLGLA